MWHRSVQQEFKIAMSFQDSSLRRSWCKSFITKSVFKLRSHIFPDFHTRAIIIYFQPYVYKICPLFFLCDARVLDQTGGSGRIYLSVLIICNWSTWCTKANSKRLSRYVSSIRDIDQVLDLMSTHKSTRMDVFKYL